MIQRYHYLRYRVPVGAHLRYMVRAADGRLLACLLWTSAAWEDADRVRRLITEEIPAKVAGDTAYRNARENSDRQNARIEHDEALKRVMTAVLNDDMQLFKQFTDNEGFRRWLTDAIFSITYEAA